MELITHMKRILDNRQCIVLLPLVPKVTTNNAKIVMDCAGHGCGFRFVEDDVVSFCTMPCSWHVNMPTTSLVLQWCVWMEIPTWSHHVAQKSQIWQGGWLWVHHSHSKWIQRVVMSGLLSGAWLDGLVTIEVHCCLEGFTLYKTYISHVFNAYL